MVFSNGIWNTPTKNKLWSNERYHLHFYKWATKSILNSNIYNDFGITSVNLKKKVCRIKNTTYYIFSYDGILVSCQKIVGGLKTLMIAIKWMYCIHFVYITMSLYKKENDFGLVVAVATWRKIAISIFHDLLQHQSTFFNF